MVVVFNRNRLVDLASGIVSEKLEVDGQRLTETQDFPDADQIEIFDRANNSKRISFTATREHKDEDTAELFAHTHDEDCLGVGPLLVVGSFNSWERYYNTAACTRCVTYAEGCRTWSSYEFVTGLSAIKP